MSINVLQGYSARSTGSSIRFGHWWSLSCSSISSLSTTLERRGKTMWSGCLLSHVSNPESGGKSSLYPIQKESLMKFRPWLQVVKLIKDFPERPVTAAIGDGANDVSMIQEAHIGLGKSHLLNFYVQLIQYVFFLVSLRHYGKRRTTSCSLCGLCLCPISLLAPCVIYSRTMVLLAYFVFGYVLFLQKSCVQHTRGLLFNFQCLLHTGTSYEKKTIEFLTIQVLLNCYVINSQCTTAFYWRCITSLSLGYLCSSSPY